MTGFHLEFIHGVLHFMCQQQNFKSQLYTADIGLRRYIYIQTRYIGPSFLILFKIFIKIYMMTFESRYFQRYVSFTIDCQPVQSMNVILKNKPVPVTHLIFRLFRLNDCWSQQRKLFGRRCSVSYIFIKLEFK